MDIMQLDASQFFFKFNICRPFL